MNLVRSAVLILLIVGLTAGAKAQVRIIPIAEGWARNQINTVVFRNSVTSFKNFQYVAFYDAESRVVLAKRKLGSTSWEIKVTHFTGNTADAHNSISIAVDGHGVLHLSWNNHNTPLHYAKGASPGSLELKEATMLGDREAKATYPEFFNLPNGDLLFLYRDGASGNGNLVLNRYDLRSTIWTRVQDNLIDGESVRNAYSQAAIDARGRIHISWVWRESPDVATNHDLCYARSDDGGKTWARSNGEKYQLPITAATAEYAWRIPQNSELINQTSMTADDAGKPYIATYWRDKDSTVPQYRLVYLDGSTWRSSQITHRTRPFTLAGGGTKRIPISRPQVILRRRQVFVIYRDEERGNRATIASSADVASDKWSVTDLTGTDLRMWEPTFDHSLWTSRGELHLFVQTAGQGDGERLEQIPSQMVSVLEWRPN